MGATDRTSIVPAVLLAWACGCHRAAPAERIGHRGDPILGGVAATTAQLYGTVALLDVDGALFCTGTAIAPTVVVSAAHCVVELDDVTGEVTGALAPEDLTVVAGTLDATTAAAEDTFALRKVVPHPAHPGYASSDPDGLGRDEDIALLLLKSPLTNVKPVPVLPVSDLDARLSPGTPLAISGYGARTVQGALMGKLYIAEIPYQRRSSTELLAGGKGKPDTCLGDSGGPAYILQDGAPLLVGATARASDAASDTCGDSGIYTLVPAYDAWLRASSEGEYPASGTGSAGGASNASVAVAAATGAGGAGATVEAPLIVSGGCTMDLPCGRRSWWTVALALVALVRLRLRPPPGVASLR